MCSLRVVWIKSLKAVDIRNSHIPILQHLGYTVLVDFEKANKIKDKKHLEWSLRWGGSKRREHTKIHQPFHKIPYLPPCHSFKNQGGQFQSHPLLFGGILISVLGITLFFPSLPLTSVHFMWLWNTLKKHVFKILFYFIMNCLSWKACLGERVISHILFLQEEF